MIEEILRKRKNLNFFRDDKVPDKKVIEDILQKTHESLPTKNNLNAYEVEVYGPEHYDEKKLVALSSVCSTAGKPFTKSNKLSF